MKSLETLRPRSLALLALTLLAGCPTAFTGSAHVSDGKAGCERKCKQNGLRFTGMVFMGEYSSACICEPKSLDAGAPSPTAASAAAASAGAAVGSMSSPPDPEQGNTPLKLAE